jgi:hypothetical protein
MPLLQTSVDFTDHFAEITRSLEHMAQRAVQVAAEEGAVAANARGAERGFHVDVEPTRPTYDGFMASFVCRKPHAWFHEYGTLGNRRKKLKQSPRTNRTRAPGTGITPLGFLSAGRRAGTRAMMREISGGR